MGRSRVEVAVGIFVIIGLVALSYLSIKLGRVDLFGGGTYPVIAMFPATGGLKAGAPVEIAGVEIGRVDRIDLVDYEARITLRIQSGVQIQDDAIVSIKTRGLIGEKFLRISPGGSEKIVPPNGRIREVEAPVDLEELISKYIFGKV
jgi:phospholipid/cholesterol/gamma-HCH transport system substrate-binding protein